MLKLLTLALFLGLTNLPCSAATKEPPVPNFALVNHEGKPFQLYDLKGKYLFVSFIYTRCPLSNMCPLTITLNRSLHSKWAKLKDKPGLHFLLVTLDPQFDTADTLKKFGVKRGLNFKNFTLVTGNEQTLSDFASQFNVIGFPSDGMISHNMKSILLDPNLVPIKEYKENEWKAEEVLKELIPRPKG